MSDKNKHSEENPLISRFSISGISKETLNNSADVAKLLCKQSCPVDSSTLDPRHFNDYQDLIFELSRKK
jgi:hypothetical protein|tara:strand:- start:4021 stop:4227 length:207 start_codon:yes stop_codon:yes gene_type:complete